MAYFNVKNRGLLILILVFLSLPVFGNKLFYLSTDRTYSVDELKRVKVESGSLNEVKIRVYKINDTEKYFLSQEDFHRPKVVGRKFRYVTPDVVKGFKNYLKSEFRSWSRENMPGNNRKNILKKYRDLSTTSEEKYYYPTKQVDYIKDSNFSLVEEKKYVFERRSNNWNTNYVYFNSLNPGTYLIEGITGNKLAYTVLNISPFSFITKKAGDEIQLYAVNNKNAEPLSNIEFTIYDQFRNKLATEKSDSEGIAKVTLKDNNIFIVGTDNNGNYSFYDPRYYPSSVSERTVYLYTDRPVYKGGDKVNLKGIVRDINKGVYKETSAKDATISIWSNDKNISGNIKSTISKDGVFSGNSTLPENAQAGLYKIKANIDNKNYEAEFKVEYYIKPEFKLNVKAEKTTYMTGEKVKFNLKGEFYHGDPVVNSEVNYVISRTRYTHKKVSKNELDSYLSAQEWVYTGIERLSSGTTTLNDLGTGFVEFTVKKGDITGNTPYTYIITATVKNRGGSDVTSGGSVKVVPVNLRVGLKTHKFVYQPAEKITLEVEAADYDNTPISTELDIKVFSKAAGEKELLTKKSVNTDEAGKGLVDFEVDNPGYVSIEVTGKDSKGNSVTSEKAVWIGEEGAAYSVSGGFIKMVLDKSYYGTKDNAKLLIVSPIADVPMLLTIEGTEIYSSKVIRLKENSAFISIPLKEKYLPNAFITVDFIYENRHYNNSIKLDIPPREKFLNIKLSPEKETFSPETKGKVKVKVTDKDGKPVENTNISIAVVDEAIYAISEDLAVDIRKFFYHFRRNNVMTWTSSGFRFYGYAYNVKRELAAKYYKDATGIAAFKGGDDEEEEERKDFKDSILWLPEIKTDKNGEAEFTIDFPSNITSWRITAIAMDSDSRVGIKRSNVITKKDIFTKISIPKVVGEYDESTFYINLYNNSFTSKKLTVKSSLDNLTGGEINTTVEIPAYKTHIIEQKVKSVKPGEGSIKVVVSEGDRIHDTITKTVDVNYHSLEKSVSAIKNLSKDDNSLTLNRPSDLTGVGKELKVSLISSYAGHINDSLKYLAQYPHGCVEQTTNKFLPNLAVVSAFKKTGLPLNGMEEKLQKNIDAGISKLSSYQNENGSWGWWRDGNENLFMTSYVLYALSFANNLYYSVNHNTLEKGLDYLKDNLGSGLETEKLFALYVLGLNGKRVESVYNSYDPESLSDYELALLMLTARSYSDGNKVKEVGELLLSKGKSDENGMYWGNDKTVEWHNDHIETTSWVLRALASHTTEENLYPIADYLISKKSGDKWKSTRDTAVAIMGISEIAPRLSKNSGMFSLILNGEKLEDISLNSNGYIKTFYVNPDKLRDSNIFELDGLKKNRITLNANLKYHTASEKISEGVAGASITRKYYSLKDNGDSYSLGNEITSVNKGDNFVVELNYTQEQSGEYVMITDNYPGGAVYNKDINIFDIEGINSSFPEAQDARYGKIHFYFTSSGNKKVYYILKANYPGDYEVSPAVGELMYFPDYRGNSSSDNFVIKGDNK